MPDTQPLGGEPPINGNFLLEVDGVEIGVFREVSGLTVSVEVVEHTEGGQNGFRHKLPGRMSWPNLVFRRGLTNNDALFAWVGKTSGEGFAANGDKLPRCTGAVTVLDSQGKRLRAWQLDGVFAVRWDGPRLVADGSSPLEEELEVAHHGFRAKTS